MNHRLPNAQIFMESLPVMLQIVLQKGTGSDHMDKAELRFCRQGQDQVYRGYAALDLLPGLLSQNCCILRI